MVFFLLLVLLFLAPAAQYIPKAFLAGILLVVSFKMINITEFKTIMRISKTDAIVLFVTFGLTVLTDLVFAVQVGMVFAVFLLFVRMAKIIDVTTIEDYDTTKGLNSFLGKDKKLRGNVAVYTLHGPFFFGAMNVFEKKIDEHMHASKKHIVLRMKHVPFIDSSGVERLRVFIQQRQLQGSTVYLSGLQSAVKDKIMANHELKELLSKGKVFVRTREALAAIKKGI